MISVNPYLPPALTLHHGTSRKEWWSEELLFGVSACIIITFVKSVKLSRNREKSMAIFRSREGRI